jgi:hypothetical protein
MMICRTELHVKRAAVPPGNVDLLDVDSGEGLQIHACDKLNLRVYDDAFQ